MTDVDSKPPSIGATPLPLVTGKFAVFRRRKSGARFEALHDTLEIAQTEATRLLLSAKAQGKPNPCYYVVKIAWYCCQTADGFASSGEHP